MLSKIAIFAAAPLAGAVTLSASDDGYSKYAGSGSSESGAGGIDPVKAATTIGAITSIGLGIGAAVPPPPHHHHGDHHGHHHHHHDHFHYPHIYDEGAVSSGLTRYGGVYKQIRGKDGKMHYHQHHGPVDSGDHVHAHNVHWDHVAHDQQFTGEFHCVLHFEHACTRDEYEKEQEEMRSRRAQTKNEDSKFNVFKAGSESESESDESDDSEYDSFSGSDSDSSSGSTSYSSTDSSSGSDSGSESDSGSSSGTYPDESDFSSDSGSSTHSDASGSGSGSGSVSSSGSSSESDSDSGSDSSSDYS